MSPSVTVLKAVALFVASCLFVIAPVSAQQPFQAQEADAKLKSLLEELQKTEGTRFQETSDASGVYYICEVKGATDPATGTTSYRNVFVWADIYKLSDGSVLKDRQGNDVVKIFFESTVYKLPEGFTASPVFLQEINKRNSSGWLKMFLTSDSTTLVQRTHCWLRNADAAILNEELLELSYGSTNAARDFHNIVQGLSTTR